MALLTAQESVWSATQASLRMFLTETCHDFRNALRNVTLRRASLALLVANLLLVAAAIGQWLLVKTQGYPEEFMAWLKLTRDGGLPELFGYAQEIAAAAIMAACAWRWKNAVYGFWAGLLSYIALDDSLALHERVGAVLGETLFAQTSVTRPQDLGELTFLSAVAFVALAGLVWAFWRTPRYQWRRGLLMFIPVFLFAGLAGGVDFAAHILPAESNLMGSLLAFVEDGGEQLSVCLMLITALVIAATEGDAQIAHGLVR